MSTVESVGVSALLAPLYFLCSKKSYAKTVYSAHESPHYTSDDYLRGGCSRHAGANHYFSG